VQRANSRPPPRAREETALMVGMGRDERAVNVLLRSERNFAVLLNSFYQRGFESHLRIHEVVN
jgi:hypothetical protein